MVPDAIPSGELIRVLSLQIYDQQKISAGKLREWLFVNRSTLEKYLTDRVQQVDMLKVILPKD
jgi:hypothetical protein